MNKENIRLEEKIKKLEKKIADMQAWQDYLEEKQENRNNIGQQLKEYEANKFRSSIISRFISLVKENNLSPDIGSKFYDLLVEKHWTIRNLYKENTPYEKLQKEIININTRYDELISGLLSQEDFDAYKEYLKYQNERAFFNKFKKSLIFGDTHLGKQQETELIAAMMIEWK